MIEIVVNSTNARLKVSSTPITTGLVGFKAKFRFSSDWDGLTKVGVITGSGQTIDVAVADNGEFVIPHECVANSGGFLKIGVCGTNSDSTVVIPTVYCNLGMIQEGADPTGDESSEPTQTLFQQMIATAKEAIASAEKAEASAKSYSEAAAASAKAAEKSAASVEAKADAAAASASAAAISSATAATKANEAEASAQAAAASEAAAANYAESAHQWAETANQTKEQYNPCTYTGVDLSVKFSDEIKSYSSVWAWIKARIKAGNYGDLHVGDYIPFKTTNSVSLNAQIAGFDTYYQYGDIAVGHHIDFVCIELWPTNHVSNKINFNNGISNSAPYPWLASDLYYYCNSLSGTVPSTETVGGGDGTAVDYTADGIYYYLPDALKSVIIQKRMMLPKRYSASGLLSSDNSWGWADAGKLWLPTEWEVYGGPVWGNAGYGSGGSAVQYPLFAHGMRRVKKRSGSWCSWWLLSAYSGNSTYFEFVNSYGVATAYNAYSTDIAVPVCFRIG
jgi:hypothetical protein